MELTKEQKRRAWKEAWIDTGIALTFNAPLNFVLLYVITYFNMGAFYGTIFMTTVFTVWAVVRKAYVRMAMMKRYEKDA